MDWKKSLCIALLAGAALAAAGCQAGNTPAATTTNTAQTPVYTQPIVSTTAPSSVKPTAPADRTMSQPPSGNVTVQGPGAPTMDLTAAATKLGVTEQQLSDALGGTQQGMPDIASAAKKLGITEDTLREALGINTSATSFNGTPPGGPSSAQLPATPTPTSSK